MSEKKTKEKRNTINVPLYNIDSQMNYLIQCCKDFEFEPQKLLSLIVADWIYLVQTGLAKGMDIKDVWISYLEHSERQRKNFEKLKEKAKCEN